MNQTVVRMSRVDIRALLEPVSEVSGKAYFDALTRLTCERLGASVAMVCKLSEDGKTAQTLSLFEGNRHRDELIYTLEGTPCAKVVASPEGRFLVPNNLHKLFPDDRYLDNHDLEAYAGQALTDEKGKVIGLFSALCQGPLDEEASSLCDFMALAAPHARVELQHALTLEQLREALSKSLLLNYSKSMFMANISHELKNPISTMIGYASLIRDGQADKRHVTGYAAEICSSGEGLLALISDILSLATMEISDELAREERFDLVVVARTGRRLMQAQASAKHLTLPAITNTEPIIVLGDSRHTKKALMNLLSNAIKFTGAGSITITVGLAADGSAQLTVADTGVGMTEKELEAARRPLGAFAEAYDMHQEGTGLGLPLTALLMERQHGKLVLESEKDKGTTARLVFPKERICEEESDYI